MYHSRPVQKKKGSHEAVQGWRDWERPEPRREKPVLFHKHLIEKKKKPDHKRGSVLEAISVKSSSQDRSSESTCEMEREEEKKELYSVNNFHESELGKNVRNFVLFALHYDIKCVRITPSHI